MAKVVLQEGMGQVSFDNYLMVAAIDFGTTYSGYAFSMVNEFQKDPTKIHSPQIWNSGSRSLMSLKTPTCLLLDSHRKFVAFGYDAENRYAELAEDNKHEDYLYFHRFKMSLHNTKNLNRELVIEDVTGKSSLAIEVFALSIQALKDHLLENLTIEGMGDISIQDIKWVITVPAIWSDRAKQFMRQSAEMAGIDGGKLCMALEPEAASICCQHLPLEKCTEGFTIRDVGTKYLVADLGGGTADLTVHEKLNGVQLKEICRVSGGDYGGTKVDLAFLNMLERITGEMVIRALQQENPEEYLDLIREFETKKRTIAPGKTGMINMRIPVAALNELCERHTNENFTFLVQTSVLASKVSIERDKIRIDAEYFISLFMPTIKGVINLIRQQLKNPNAKDVATLLLVGGFSGCPLVQYSIKKEFPGKHVIVPADSELAVLKGAVIFGHIPGIVTERVAKLTYGYGYSTSFDPDKHDIKYLYNDNGVKKCNNLVRVVLKQNSIVPVGRTFTYTMDSYGRKDGRSYLNIYASENNYPTYTDEEGCFKLGTIEMNRSQRQGKKIIQIIRILFGDTEISVAVEEKGTGKIVKSHLQMI